ncbi:MAG: polyprenyl synthetase family protein [Bacteroidales bacterium]|nr:polyprenyl synthetase family protein [Bacteroidales bacterium]
MNLSEIEQLISSPLTNFRQTYRTELDTATPLIGDVGRYLNDAPGKQLRPMLLMLSAGATHNDDVPSERLSVALEMLHNCTLLHDDVVDNSQLRHGRATVNRRWGNKTAVLCGDYFLARVMLMLNEINDPDINRIIDRTVMEMSTGELLQQQRCQERDASEQNYYDTIRKKTASLMAACCETGAIRTRWQSQMQEAGMHIGTAFQLRDDLLDFMPPAFTGKPTGNDIREHKLTLPLIAYLRTLSQGRRREIEKMLVQDPLPDQTVVHIVHNVVHSPAIQETQRAIAAQVAEANAKLAFLDDSPFKEGLMQITQQLVES